MPQLRLGRINTAYIERLNATLRTCMRQLWAIGRAHPTGGGVALDRLRV